MVDCYPAKNSKHKRSGWLMESPTTTNSSTWTALCDLCGTNSAATPIHNAHLIKFECQLEFTEHLLLLKRQSNESYQISLHLIQSLFRRESTTLEIVLKSLDAWRLKFSNDSECAEFYGRIQLAVATSDIRQRPYAVRFRQEFDLGFESDYGWDVYNVDRMMDRMAISTSEWRISDINSGYQLSESLPERLIVPAAIEDKLLREVAAFRQSRRIPHLTYHHPVTRAIIARSGQPLMGSKQRRSIEDEQYIQQLLNTKSNNAAALQTSTNRIYPCIIEARTKASGSAAKTKGGGYEADGQYVRIRMFFTTMEQPSSTKDAFVKFIEAFKSEISASSFINDVGDWMRQVQSCLRPATFLAKAIAVEGASCLVHCDEGVDNTAILVSLAKILIDPYYRTIDGFMALIEEDWLQAGFRFADRSQPPSNLPQLPLAAASIAVTAATSALSPTIGSPRLLSAGDIFTPNNNNSHSRSGSGSPLSSAIENVVQQSAATLSALTLSAGINGAGGGDLQQQVPWSPVFWLFLDCVYQIYHQFSREFQFNPQILQFLIQQTAAGQFGTFLANSPKELTELRQANRTLSLWTFISLTRDYFTNPLYDPTFTKITGGSREDPDAKTAPPLPITSNSRRLTFLSGLFDPFDPASPLADWHRMKWMLAHASLPPTPSVLDCCTLLQRRALALKQRRKELSIKLPAAQCKLSAVQSLYVNHIKEERVRDRQQRVAKMLCDKCQAPLCTC